MRAVSVHRDAIVVTSLLWQTTATALRAGGETMLIDSPYFPDELELLPTLLKESGFSPTALVATHGDFDHVLGRLAFPELSLGVPDTTAERLQGHPGEAQRELRAEDAGHYVQRPRPLSLGQVQSLPVPGKLEVGGAELELHPAEGHTADGMAIFSPEHGVLICGDYLSPVEVPMISQGGSVTGYRETLIRLAGLLGRSETVVPGHGSPLTPEAARSILEEDVAYLGALERGDERAKLPKRRDTSAQRRIHAANVARVT